MVGLGTFFAIIACLGAWADRQLLDTGNWVHTSDQLIADPAIQTALASYVSTQLISSPQTVQKIRSALPAKAGPLAGPLAGALGDVANRVTLRLLETKQFQKLWETTNRLTHQQLVKVVNGQGRFKNGAVVLDLRPFNGAVAKRLGVNANLTGSPDGRIVIVKPKQLSAVQNGVKLLRTVRWVSLALTVLLFAGAIALAEDRRRAVLSAGAGLVVAALIVLVVRRVLGHVAVHSITNDGPTKPAADSVWQIATSLLRTIAISGLILGLIAMAGAWFAGPARWAVSARRWTAPVLRDSPAIVFGAVGIVLLVLLLTGLLPTSGTAIGALAYIVVIAAGVFLLRRQIAREFPAGQ